ncbi:hypothetical protein AB0H82_09135 [Streptomyces sp. NPDC050732]|uniref:hypothetical protein n=1 Tax=Streptomyces sp. NPDC050732 TaxID=3154632 RepID=UPI003416464A
MNITQFRRQCALWLLALASSLGLAVWVSIRLASYDVPLTLITACGLCVAACTLNLLERLAEARSTTHRCPAAGCTFKVTVRGVDAAENRRWQEIAATHPTHDA